MSRTKSFLTTLPPVLLAVSLLGIYASTLAPGLTWANGGSDGGDLIAAAATGGIAHPTGYPLYLLLARLFQLLPVGSLAFRTNLMSAVFTSLGAMLVYKLVTRSFSPLQGGQAWLAGIVAGYAFGLAPLIWSQAVITEVYAIHAFLVISILYLYAKPEPGSMIDQKNLDRQRGLVLGLGMGNHVTLLLLVPMALFLGSFHKRAFPDRSARTEKSWFGTFRLDTHSLLRQLLWFALGLCLYMILPLRALSHPPVNWGNPVTPGRFWWLVSGDLYQGYYLQFALSGLWEHIQAWAALLLQQFGPPGLILGVIGLVIFITPSHLYLLSIWTAAVFMGFAVFYNSPDSYVYLIPMFTSFAIWIGLGIGGLLNQFSARFPKIALVFGLTLLAYFVGRSVTHLSQVDASYDYRAENFGSEILSAAPEKAILFAKGDQAVFALWYFHFALRQRSDLTVIASDLLHFDWYQENLKTTYPALIIPGPFPWPATVAAANPLRTVCFVQYVDRPEMECGGLIESP